MRTRSPRPPKPQRSPAHRYPVAPLLARCRIGPCGAARLLGIDPVTLRRWDRAGGLDEFQADWAACRLGFHPGIVWPTWLADGILTAPVATSAEETAVRAPIRRAS